MGGVTYLSPVTDPSTTPATQADVAAVLERVGSLEDHVHSFETSVKDQMQSLRGELRGEMQSLKKDLTHSFDLAVELIRSDLIGANNDRIGGLENRVGALEQRVGV